MEFLEGTGNSEFVNLGPQKKKAVNQMAAASRESESFGRLSPVFRRTSYRGEGSRLSDSKTESPVAKRAIAQVLMAVREIAARRRCASQGSVLTKGAPQVRIEIIWLSPNATLFITTLCFWAARPPSFTNDQPGCRVLIPLDSRASKNPNYSEETGTSEGAPSSSRFSPCRP